MRGGKRPGAGAPKKEEPTKSLQIRVPVRLINNIKQLIKTYLDENKRK